MLILKIKLLGNSTPFKIQSRRGRRTPTSNIIFCEVRKKKIKHKIMRQNEANTHTHTQPHSHTREHMRATQNNNKKESNTQNNSELNKKKSANLLTKEISMND